MHQTFKPARIAINLLAITGAAALISSSASARPNTGSQASNQLQFASGTSFQKSPSNAPEIVGLFTYYEENSIAIERVPNTTALGIRINTITLVITRDGRRHKSESNNSDFILTCSPHHPWKSTDQAYYVQLKQMGVRPDSLPEGLADEMCSRQWLRIID